MQRILIAPTRRTIASVIIAVFLAAWAADARASFETITPRGPQKISSAFSRNPSLANNGSNRFVAVWADRSGADGIYASDLRLGSWTRPALIPGSQDGEDPVVAMAPNGATIVVWSVQHGDPRSGQIGVSYRSPSGPFTAAKYVASNANGTTNEDLAVAINSAGRYVLGWTRTDDDRSVQALFGTGATPGAVQTLDSGASGVSVAIDGTGRAIALYARAENDVRQALAPAGGGFGAATTIDTGYVENGASNKLRVATNSSGKVVAGWGDTCDSPRDCDNIFFAKMAIGDLTSGIVATQQVSNAGDGPSSAGPDRKHDDRTEVAIDESGNATMVWDASDSSIPGYDLWAAHFTPGGGFSPSASFGTATVAVDDELQLVAANGHVVTAWVDSPAAGQPGLVYMSQVDVPATGAAAWPTPTVVSTPGADADSLDLALSAGGQLALVWRVADRIWANTSAPRDTTKPTFTLPRSGTNLRLRATGTAPWRVGCPATEADCMGTARATTRVMSNGAMRDVVVGTGSWYALGGRAAFAELRLTRAAKLRLASEGRLAVTVTTNGRDAAGNVAAPAKRTAVLLPARG